MKVNAFLIEIKSDNIIETNRLIRGCFIFVGEKVDIKPNQRRGNAGKVPWWKRRIKQSVQELQKHINILERKKREEIKKKQKYRVIEDKYRVKKKVLDVVLEELKQTIQAKVTKIKRYDQRIDSIELTDCSNKIKKECTNS